jgi:tol-pal system protein YbgF
VATSGGDAEILGTIEKKDFIDEPFEIARNFQTPDDLFNYGKNSLQNLNYTEAENVFRGFVKKYPKNEKVPNAYYWIGESLFVRENYPEAVLAYGEVIRNYKKHKKAPASLLKIGISFSNLDKKKESCNALNQILKQYPDSERDVLKKTNYIIKENNC